MELGAGGTVLCRTGRRNPKIMQDGKRDWATVIEVIAGDGKVLAPLVIHLSTVHLMSHHSNINYEISTDAFFTHSKGRYTSSEITLDWFDQVLNHVHDRLLELWSAKSLFLMATARLSTTFSSLSTLSPIMCILSAFLLIQLISYNPWILDCFSPWATIINKSWRTFNATMGPFGR